MANRRIIFVPGKNPKPPPAQHRSLLWRTLLEGVNRAEPGIVGDLSGYADNFNLMAWNYLYYHETKDETRDLPWVDALIHTHGPSKEDVLQADSWHLKLDRILFTTADVFAFLIPLLPEPLRMTTVETKRYFENKDNIASEIREELKKTLRPLLSQNATVLLIGHSLGSVIAYDTLWELSHVENLRGRIDRFLTLGSPLGMHYVQRRLMGAHRPGRQRYPMNIGRWVNVAAVGDLTALDRKVSNDFREMREFGIIDTIEDYCEGIYNFFRNEDGLNCHRSYGYLVNPAVGKIVTDWWLSAE